MAITKTSEGVRVGQHIEASCYNRVDVFWSRADQLLFQICWPQFQLRYSLLIQFGCYSGCLVRKWPLQRPAKASELVSTLRPPATTVSTSPAQSCKTWDCTADGYCRADGVGSIVMKRLDDALADNDIADIKRIDACTRHYLPVQVRLVASVWVRDRNSISISRYRHSSWRCRRNGVYHKCICPCQGKETDLQAHGGGIAPFCSISSTLIIAVTPAAASPWPTFALTVPALKLAMPKKWSLSQMYLPLSRERDGPPSNRSTSP
jgi:hypothetical protein